MDTKRGLGGRVETERGGGGAICIASETWIVFDSMFVDFDITNAQRIRLRKSTCMKLRGTCLEARGGESTSKLPTTTGVDLGCTQTGWVSYISLNMIH